MKGSCQKFAHLRESIWFDMGLIGGIHKYGLKYIKLTSRDIRKLNNSCTCYLYAAGRNDFDADKSITRAIGRVGP
jgi:hypothetical protein